LTQCKAEQYIVTVVIIQLFHDRHSSPTGLFQHSEWSAINSLYSSVTAAADHSSRISLNNSK